MSKFLGNNADISENNLIAKKSKKSKNKTEKVFKGPNLLKVCRPIFILIFEFCETFDQIHLMRLNLITYDILPQMLRVKKFRCSQI